MVLYSTAMCMIAQIQMVGQLTRWLILALFPKACVYVCVCVSTLSTTALELWAIKL